MFRLSTQIFAFLLAFLLLLPLPQSFAYPVNQHAVTTAGSNPGNNFHATRNFGATAPTVLSPGSIYVPRTLSLITLYARESSIKTNKAYPVIIGLGVCLVVAIGIAFVYFRQRTLSRRAAAAAATGPPVAPDSSSSDSSPGASDTREHAVTLHGVHEQQSDASIPGREQRSYLDLTVTERDTDSQKT
ncbi:hypothetical protein MSAN_00829100 [Mycena sanguinolenta]|uniref:Uncharacterized protein n=1 Tax=Mycena sanguinolenta TaxID=230812 RepID=A0A8H6YZL2_9AGAR|nr:hypothetical protein MSAN_00829100 [Mycena sanguinolenta]